MDSARLLWETMVFTVQLLWTFWPITLMALLPLLVKIGTDIYKTNCLAKSGMADIDKLSGEEFERYLEILFKKLGYQVKRTPYQGDYGADLILREDDGKTVVQVKQYKRTVGVKAIQEAVTAKEYYRCNQAMVVTNSYFSRQAKTLARATQVELWDRDDLVTRLLSVQMPASTQFAATTATFPTNQVASQPSLTPSATATCEQCGKPVSTRVRDYCMNHAHIFGGRIYCYEHQKAIRRRQAAR